MGVVLTRGGNVSLGEVAPGLGTVLVGLGWTAAAGYELDASALLCDREGRVSDQNFVFFNNLRSPDGSVRHRGAAPAGSGDREQLEIDLAAVPDEVRRIVFAVAIYEAAQRGQTFGQVRGARIRLTDPVGGAELARYDLVDEAAGESAMVFGELYRHVGGWKFRAVGQGYATGLAGIAADFGVRVLQQAAEPSTPPPPAPAAAPFPPAPGSAPVPPAPAPFPLTATLPMAGAAPVATPFPSAAPVPAPAARAADPRAAGSPAAACFFDPAHGAGSASVLWSPQWGTPRGIHACASCAQRVLSTAPPFYTPPQPVQAAYPQPVQAAYPQPAPGGYPQPVPGGYPPAGVRPQQAGPDQGRRFGTGALIGAGAAGILGGILLDEALSDDEPDVVVNNYYEDDGFF
ncbi:TerD family protein [Kitasatospora sp. NBC_01287]|uniref:TerD family protein n=1 Tax=Kitasatospora sp. NBC_01287 TaxID=2903573 RepID=UPI002B1D8A89|nr:TerD family protein [Kitasatospora sp. NBC_01287]